MKKLVLIFIAIALYGCQYDDMWIKEEFAELDGRISALERLCDNLNSDIQSMNQIVAALNECELIASVSEILENGKVTGYRIKFESGKEICIYHGRDGQDGQDGQDGEDGKDGQDGHTPQISVRQDTDGEWYWTIDGEWMLDQNGNKVTTTGRTDLVPELKIEDMYWYISYDGGSTWTKLYKAVGEDGKSYFSEVSQDDDNVYLTLADGSRISIPKIAEFSLILGISGDIPCSPGKTITIPYTLQGRCENAEVVTISEGDWRAEVISSSAVTGNIVITAPEDINDGKVAVVASTAKKTIIKSLTFTEGVFTTTGAFKLSDNGGKFSINVSTNYNYTVETNASWISHEQTKAVRNEEVTFNYSALPAGTRTRSAKITFKDELCGTVCTIDVTQGSLVSLNKSSLMLMTGEEETLSATVLSENKNVVWSSSDSDVAWVSQEGKVVAVAKGKATITVMTSDYEHMASCTVEVGVISDYIYLQQAGASNVSYSNGYVHSGTKLSWYFYNQSSENVYAKYATLVDKTGAQSGRMSINDNIMAGSRAFWTITLGSSYMAPSLMVVYEYRGKEYSCICGHMFN